MQICFYFSASSLLIDLLLGAQSTAASLVLQNTTHYYICSRVYLSTNSLIYQFCTFPPFLVLGSVICCDASVHFCGPSGERPFTFTQTTKMEWLLDIIQTNQGHLFVGKINLYTKNDRRSLFEGTEN